VSNRKPSWVDRQDATGHGYAVHKSGGKRHSPPHKTNVSQSSHGRFIEVSRALKTWSVSLEFHFWSERVVFTFSDPAMTCLLRTPPICLLHYDDDEKFPFELQGVGVGDYFVRLSYTVAFDRPKVFSPERPDRLIEIRLDCPGTGVAPALISKLQFAFRLGFGLPSQYTEQWQRGAVLANHSRVSLKHYQPFPPGARPPGSEKWTLRSRRYTRSSLAVSSSYCDKLGLVYFGSPYDRSLLEEAFLLARGGAPSKPSYRPLELLATCKRELVRVAGRSPMLRTDGSFRTIHFRSSWASLVYKKRRSKYRKLYDFVVEGARSSSTPLSDGSFRVRHWPPTHYTPRLLYHRLYSAELVGILLKHQWDRIDDLVSASTHCSMGPVRLFLGPKQAKEMKTLKYKNGCYRPYCTEEQHLCARPAYEWAILEGSSE